MHSPRAVARLRDQRSREGGGVPSPSSFVSPSTSADPSCTLKGYRMLGRREDISVCIKSKLGAEFRRYALTFSSDCKPSFEDFAQRLFSIHSLITPDLQDGISIEYLDASDGTHLPINNDDTLRVAIESRPALLRIYLQRRGESAEQQHGYGVSKAVLRQAKKRPTISAPQDFRRVSAIVDADRLPITLRRVQLCKYKSNLPLGFYIRDGISYRNSFAQPGIFVSRLVDNGIAASTNLLHPNDEILEVNGIDVTEKTLDQVTDVMIANSYNLILTVRPAQACLFPSPPPDYGISPYGTTRRYESGLKSYLDIPTKYGTLSSRGSSSASARENASPPVYSSIYRPHNGGIIHPHQLFAGSPHLPPMVVPLPPPGSIPPNMMAAHMMQPAHYGHVGAHPSFSRNTTVRLSDKLRNEKEVHASRVRRPFSLYAPNLGV